MKMMRLNIEKILKIIPMLCLIGMFISCGNVTRNIGYGLSECEIEDLYNNSESMYNDILDGQIESSQKNWGKVIRQFSQIVDDYPRSKVAEEAQYNLGMSYIWSNGLLKDSSQEAIKTFDRIIKNTPTSDFAVESQYWKAYAYSLAGDYKRAIEEYEKFGVKYPQSSLYPESLYQIHECRIRLDGTKKPDESKKQGSSGIEQKNLKDRIKSPKKELPSLTPSTPALIPKNQEQDKRSYIRDVRFSSSQRYTRVVLDLNKPLEYEANKIENPLRLYIDIKKAIIFPAKQNITVNDDLVKGIRIAQFNENIVRIVIDLKSYKRYKVFTLKNPNRIVVDVYGQDHSNNVTLKNEKPKNAIPKPDQPTTLVRQLGLKVRTIVIDPGHGGKDPGAMSGSGLCEKNLVLDIAKRLKNLLKSKWSYEVHLTRETDVFVPLEERTNFANQKDADLFVSIHVNSTRNSDVRGIETYFLSLAGDEESRLTASLENASAERGIRDLASLLGRMLKTAKVSESRAFAQVVQSHLCQITRAYDRGVRSAPFIVLIGASAPSILVELGFISNEQDEKLLNSEEYKDKLATALMESIEDYIRVMNST